MVAPFEKTAKTYDEQRGIPPAASEQIRAAIMSQLPGVARPWLLEIGVGTGRYAKPLQHEGWRYIGIDSSSAMLARCQAKLAAGIAGRRVDLVQGDAKCLPFPDQCFDIVVAASVFRVITPWHVAARESLRVLKRPGLIVLVQHMVDEDSIEGRLRRQKRRFLQQIGIGAEPAGGASDAAVAQYFETQGATSDLFETARWSEARTPRQIIQRHLHGNRVAGQPWAPELAETLERAAEAAAGSLDSTQPVHRWLRVYLLDFSEKELKGRTAARPGRWHRSWGVDEGRMPYASTPHADGGTNAAIAAWHETRRPSVARGPAHDPITD
jgi:ubiquinone/menaquinone biosynthesis C-methylase UbiE